MGDASGEEGEGVEALGFDVFLGFRVAAGVVADEHDVAEGKFLVFRVVDGREVEIEHAVLGVEDFDVAGDGLLRAIRGNALDAMDF